MALRTIRLAGDPALSRKCREVRELTPRLQELISDMFDTMYDANGVGLAAPQVGVLKRIVVIDITEDRSEPYVLVDPVIVEKDGSQTGEEGCLSLPGKSGVVTRPYHVICEAYDRHMKEIRVDAEGLLARAICHELDHLDGHMYTEFVEGDLHDVRFDDGEEA